MNKMKLSSYFGAAGVLNYRKSLFPRKGQRGNPNIKEGNTSYTILRNCSMTVERFTRRIVTKGAP